jgi:hypothetical protein
MPGMNVVVGVVAALTARGWMNLRELRDRRAHNTDAAFVGHFVRQGLEGDLVTTALSVLRAELGLGARFPVEPQDLLGETYGCIDHDLFELCANLAARCGRRPVAPDAPDAPDDDVDDPTVEQVIAWLGRCPAA